ncbi:MAG TPA: SMC-Scp complex subunit ScpB [Gammaproteobacteria bacterium]|jgi:segregation and condensation protein B|nr:SMC-Scp complex subunit ScpB [Gammaproteobacteria bacterium]
MNGEKLKNIIEAILLASYEPLSADKLHRIITSKVNTSKSDILSAINDLKTDYENKDIEITKVASGFRIQAKSEIGDYLNIMFAERTPRYSRALLETLSIIAYRQPVTRGDIEAIRGVSVSTSIMRTLTERNWVRIIGYRDVPGKPAMFATTPEFLDYFSLQRLDQLPDLPEKKEPLDLDLELDDHSVGNQDLSGNGSESVSVGADLDMEAPTIQD